MLYRVQLFVNENSRRGRVLLGSWTCPTKEVAEKKFSNLNNYADEETNAAIVSELNDWLN